MSDQAQPRILNNRFQLERKLGQGGMATVYLARDLRLNRPVAIKMLHGQYAADEQFLRRFKHEADAAAQLGHPNIVRVYDVGTEGDIHFIVMEYIAGSDLKEIISLEAPLPVGRTLRIVQQIAEALQAAHDFGLVHRDVKPQNVLIDGEDRVHLSDFGIAKSDRSSAYTDPGTTFGTADYLAPEQAQGLGATPRSDIYALGVVTYEMLTGRLPFTGDTALAVAMQHVQSPPPLPRQFNPAIPPQLERIILNAMAKDPSQRPSSARAFAEQLRHYRERGDQPTAGGPTVPPPAAQGVPGSPPAAAAVGPTIPQPTPQAPRSSGPDAPTVINAPRPQRPPAQQQQAAAPQPRRVDRTPMNVPPPLAPQATPQPVPQKRRSGCGFFILGLLLLGGIVGLVYAIFFTDLLTTLDQTFGWNLSGNNAPTAVPGEPTAPPQPTATVELATVPQLVGLTEQEALDQLKALGFQEHRDPPRKDPAPAATVIEQAIAPNTQIARGSVVTITLSLGPGQSELPDVRGQTFEAAAATLQSLGFKVARSDVPNAKIAAGTVTNQSKPAGIAYDQGIEILLEVSLGDVVRFPDIIGAQRDDAVGAIRAADGLIMDVVDEQGPDVLPNFDQLAPNQVVSATANGAPVDNGQYVPRDSRIVLGVRRP